MRRWIIANDGRVEGTAQEAMTVNPATIEPDLLAVEGLEAFQNFPRPIGEMPVIEGGKVVGLLMLKDLLRAGLV